MPFVSGEESSWASVTLRTLCSDEYRHSFGSSTSTFDFGSNVGAKDDTIISLSYATTGHVSWYINGVGTASVALGSTRNGIQIKLAIRLLERLCLHFPQYFSKAQ